MEMESSRVHSIAVCYSISDELCLARITLIVSSPVCAGVHGDSSAICSGLRCIN